MIATAQFHENLCEFVAMFLRCGEKDQRLANTKFRVNQVFVSKKDLNYHISFTLHLVTSTKLDLEFTKRSIVNTF